MLTKIRSSLLVASSALLLFSGLSSVSAASVDRKPISIMLDGFPLPFPVAPFCDARNYDGSLSGQLLRL